MGIRRAAWNININWNNLVDAAEAGVVLPEDAATAPAGADGNHQAGRRSGVESLAQGQFHIARDRAGDQQHIGVARGGDEMDTEAFDIVNGAVEAGDFYFATVA